MPRTTHTACFSTKRVIAGPRSIGVALLEVIPSVVDLAIHLQPKRVLGKGCQSIVRSQNHGVFLAGDRSGIVKDGEMLDPRAFWTRVQQLVAFATTKEAS